MGLLPQIPISLGVNFIIKEGPLDFNMLLDHGYVYYICGVYALSYDEFMSHGSIVTIDQHSFVEPLLYQTLDLSFPWFVSSVSIDTTLPQVNYMAS